MKAERAIEILKYNEQTIWQEGLEEEHTIALNMAIDALTWVYIIKNKPCEFCERDVTVKIIKGKYDSVKVIPRANTNAEKFREIFGYGKDFIITIENWEKWCDQEYKAPTSPAKESE